MQKQNDLKIDDSLDNEGYPFPYDSYVRLYEAPATLFTVEDYRNGYVICSYYNSIYERRQTVHLVVGEVFQSEPEPRKSKAK